MFSLLLSSRASSSFFFFNDTATTEIYTLSLHDALPIALSLRRHPQFDLGFCLIRPQHETEPVAVDQLGGQLVDHTGLDTVGRVALLHPRPRAALDLLHRRAVGNTFDRRRSPSEKPTRS